MAWQDVAQSAGQKSTQSGGQAGGWGQVAASAGAGLLGGMGIQFGAKRREKRALKNQMQLMELQQKNQMELNRQGHEIQLDMWNKTNFGAQMEHLKAAGLNPGLMYGMGGAGGSTAGGQGGGSASGGSAQMGQTGVTMDIGNMMQMAQMQLLQAQADKAKAEAENLRGGVRGNLEEDQRTKKFQNDINEKYKGIIEEGQSAEWNMKSIEGDEKNYAWIWRKTLEYGQDNDGSATEGLLKTRKGRAIDAEVKQIEEDLKNAKAAGDVSRAEAIIKEFEAALTEDGISPNSPWYAKLVTELLKKIGVVDFIKNEAKSK